MLTLILIIIASLFQVAGLAGCVLPWLAGPPLNFLGLILLCLAKGWHIFSPSSLIILGGLTLFTVIMDYVLPIAGAKKFGSSKRGFWGAFLGMILGVLFFPPFGLIIGAFIGAILGELSAGKQNQQALKAGWGVFLGFFLSMIFRLLVSGMITFFFIRALIKIL